MNGYVRFPALALAAVAVPASASPSLEAPSAIILGDPTGLEVRNLAPGEVVRLHALRRTMAVRFTDGKRVETPVIVHAWAGFAANRNGQVSADRDAPRAGTYRGQDVNGLLWSGWPVGDQRLGAAGRRDLGADTLTDNRTLIVVPEVKGRLLPARRIALQAYSDRITFRELTVARDGVSGVYAVPKGSRRWPGVIQLHGSEGGSMEQARLRAGVLAERGFAVLSINYVAYTWFGGIPGVEPAMANVPVELIDRARTWLARQSEVASDRISLYGGSKGAELALVAAAKLPWVRSVVACVPSDVVWAGYGRAARPGERLSSWSWRGQPLPSIEYDRYADVFSGKATAAEVHIRSRAMASAKQIAAARIPVERIRAPVLLLGAGKDQVWPSGEMAAAVGERMNRGRPGRAKVALFQEASHNICGTGSETQREDGQDLAADALASGAAFRQTIRFLMGK